MSSSRRFLWCVLAAGACGQPPAEGSSSGVVVEPIERWVEFAEPLPSRLYVDYRVVSYAGHLVEYGVEVGGRPLVVTYAIDTSAALPLQTRFYADGGATPLLAVLASDAVLEIVPAGGASGEPAVRVNRYTEPALAEVEAVAALELEPELRALFDAVLPARGELAPVPAFWRNLDVPPPTGDVGHSTSNERPLLPGWSAPVSLLGALFLQTPCVGRGPSYECPCITFDGELTGPVTTCP